MIEVKCTFCGTTLQVPDTAAGQSGNCKQCGAILLVPDAPAAPAAAKASKPGAKAEKTHFVPVSILLAVLLVLSTALILPTLGTGSPIALAGFALAFAIAVASLILVIAGLYDPDLPLRVLRLSLKRWHYAVVFGVALLLSVLLLWASDRADRPTSGLILESPPMYAPPPTGQ